MCHGVQVANARAVNASALIVAEHDYIHCRHDGTDSSVPIGM
jgi:hypothetical protein